MKPDDREEVPAPLKQGVKTCTTVVAAALIFTLSLSLSISVVSSKHVSNLGSPHQIPWLLRLEPLIPAISHGSDCACTIDARLDCGYARLHGIRINNCTVRAILNQCHLGQFQSVLFPTSRMQGRLSCGDAGASTSRIVYMYLCCLDYILWSTGIL